MNAKLRKIDLAGECLVNLYQAGRIDEATYTKRFYKLLARAEAELARLAAKAK